jgi:uncharacterized protein YkwD
MIEGAKTFTNMRLSHWILFISLAFTTTGCISTPRTAKPSIPNTPIATSLSAIPSSTATSTFMPSQEPGRGESTPAPAQTLLSPTAMPSQSIPASPQPSPTAINPPATPAPTQGSNPINTQPAPTPATACSDQASFEGDITIPDNTVFQPGEKFVKTWRLYNSGTCTWGAGYAVVFAYGDQLGASLSTPIPPAAPGTSIQISLDMTAPSSPGQHAGNWQLQNANGQHFGVGMNGTDYFWAQIMVSYAAPAIPPANSGQAPAVTTDAQPSTGSNPAPTATPLSTTTGRCTYTGNPEYENEILQQINSVRTSNGLTSLSLQSQLSAAARTYSIDMACNNRVDFTHHTDSNGGRWYDRIAVQGYAYAAAFENVFVGNPAYGGTPQEAMNWWMNSPIHRGNILNPDVTEIGIAYIYTSTSDYGGYYTVDFAQPK